MKHHYRFLYLIILLTTSGLIYSAEPDGETDTETKQGSYYSGVSTGKFFAYIPDVGDEEVPAGEVSWVKHNIYRFKGRLHMADTWLTDMFVDGKYSYTKASLFLNDSINEQQVESVIDIDSYTEVEANYIYKDANNIYTRKGKGCGYGCMALLSKDSKHFRVLGTLHEYAVDSDNTYCIRDGNTLKKGTYFRVIEIEQDGFGFDGENLYSMCEVMTIEELKEHFSHIPDGIKQSIVDQFFGEAL